MKNIITLLIAIVLSTTFYSCEKEETSDYPNAITKENMVGTWKPMQVYQNNEWVDFFWGDTMLFKGDGTCLIVYDNTEAIWSLSGTMMTLNYKSSQNESATAYIKILEYEPPVVIFESWEESSPSDIYKMKYQITK